MQWSDITDTHFTSQLQNGIQMCIRKMSQKLFPKNILILNTAKLIIFLLMEN